MLANLRKVHFELVVQGGAHSVHLWQPLNVHLPTVVLDHELVEAPKDLLFVLDVEKQQGDYIVHSLNIAYFIVKVSVGHQYVV